MPITAIREIELASSRLVCVGHPDVLDDAASIDLAAFDGREILGPDPDDPVGRLLNKRFEEHALNVRTTITAQSYHSLIALAACSRLVTIVDVSALSARAFGLNVAPLAQEIAIPVVASLRSAASVLRSSISSCRCAKKSCVRR
ncbi:LysR substrate-binding domain-containing protein [Caballeronia grimmiae]|uniref:LysR substrate-binding domain-containing protein n=1 Tax=Caballeronia grimmiae TaxID=1071679 RepID=UPI0038B7C2FD